MPDPIIDSINATGKPWWKSKTIWGIAVAAIGIAAPKYQPIAQVLPDVVDTVATAAGLIWALYGRIKTDGKPISNPFSK